MTYPVGDRVVLRGFTVADEGDVHAFASDPEVTRYVDWGPNTAQDTRDFLAVAQAEAAQPARDTFTLAVTLADTGRVIGTGGVWIEDRTHRRGGLGYVVHRDLWSQGYATEVAGLLLRFGFDRLGLHRVSATCRPDNVASARVLTKVGMRLEGTLTHHVLIRGVRQDSLLFAAINPAE